MKTADEVEIVPGLVCWDFTTMEYPRKVTIVSVGPEWCVTSEGEHRSGPQLYMSKKRGLHILANVLEESARLATGHAERIREESRRCTE